MDLRAGAREVGRRDEHERSRDGRERSKPPPQQPAGAKNGGLQAEERSDGVRTGAKVCQQGPAGESGAHFEMPDQGGGAAVQQEFGLSGALAEETNKVRGVVLKHAEPSEAARPDKRWRLYCFKDGAEMGEPLHIHRQSCFLFGRERRVVDVPTDHPSCSKQHAVLQFRRTVKKGEEGVRPYLMDLGAANGTYLNRERIEPQRYYELLVSDVLRFGYSSREYVLLHDQVVQD